MRDRQKRVECYVRVFIGVYSSIVRAALTRRRVGVNVAVIESFMYEQLVCKKKKKINVSRRPRPFRWQRSGDARRIGKLDAASCPHAALPLARARQPIHTSTILRKLSREAAINTGISQASRPSLIF